MAYDFPASPTPGQTFNNYVWDGEKWKLQSPPVTGAVRYDIAQGLSSTQKAQGRANIDVTKKNYIINGAMQISQENGTTAVTTGYVADQFSIGYVGPVITGQQILTPTTLVGSPARIRATVTTPKGTLAAGDYAYFYTTFEGLRMADLKFGSAFARTVTVQFGWKSPAGTFALCFRNTGGTRAYAANFTVAAGQANTDLQFAITIPGDVTGTWVTDNTLWSYLTWTYAVGTTFGTSVDQTWTATAGFGTPQVTNGVATGGAVYELFDVSLTEGTVAPPFQAPDYADELALCQRYFYKRNWPAINSVIGLIQMYNTAAGSGPLFDFPVPMRVAPTWIGTSTFIVNPGGTGITVAAGTALTTNEYAWASGYTGVTASWTAGQAAMITTAAANGFYSFYARL